jgi:hypothetical protein
MTRYRAKNLFAAAIVSICFGAAMAVTYSGLNDMAEDSRRSPSPFVLALPVVAAIAVPIVFVVMAWFEKPSERTEWQRQLRAAHPDAPRDERFARAYRVGRRANAVGRNRVEAARIRSATSAWVSAMQHNGVDEFDPALR